MDSLLYILIGLIIILIIGVIVVIVLFFNNKNNKDAGIDEEMVENMLLMRENLKALKEDIRENSKGLQNEFRETTRNIDNKLLEQHRDMNANVKHQFSESQKLISEITKEITEVKESNKQVFSMTEQLANLEKVLSNQKQRGNWGENSLQLILSNFLPEGVYQMQYTYRSGEIVDAVIFIKDRMLTIDSKFSIDNYRRCVDATNDEDKKFFADAFKVDIKKRIEETRKYIDEAGENTMPFAFMFIPSEAIYYDLNAGDNGNLKINTQKLLDFAQENKVIIVSPTSILAYLHLVITGIKDSRIEENAREIKKKVEMLGKHISVYEEYMKKLGNAMSTSVNHYNSAYKELKKIDKDVYKITEGVSGGDIEVLAIGRPEMEE